MENKFLQQTAIDYDMPYHQVKSIYDMWDNKGLFYEKLEEFISQRANLEHPKSKK